MMNKTNKDKQNENKVTTTGHKWDDNITEYNIPAPRWWLIVWFICIIWGVGYWFFYPAIPVPGGSNEGSLEWTSQKQLSESQNKILAKKNKYLEKFDKSTFDEILANRDLLEFALNGGKSAFLNNCAGCHGTGADGFKGFPNLNDDDWLWGGKIEDIYQTLKYGIRSGHEKARENAMPAFGRDKILTREEITYLVEHVLYLSGQSVGNKNGANLFQENCASCHGKVGKGNKELGAPNLTDKIWLYGGTKEDILHTINNSRAGVMPYWSSRLDDSTIRKLSIYVYSLGGGEE